MFIANINIHTPMDAPMQNPMQEFKDLWDAWWNNPTNETAQALLDYLQDNEVYLKEMGREKPCPLPPYADQNFDNYYQLAVDYLKGWMEQGCNPERTAEVSEWIADIYIWINQNAILTHSLLADDKNTQINSQVCFCLRQYPHL